MDVATTAAVLAIVAEESQQSAMEALLQEREQLAMALADRDSYLAQRHYVGSMQISRLGQPMTWETAFTQRHNELSDAHQAMRHAAHAIRDGNADDALNVLMHVIGSDTESSEADEEMSEAAETTAGEEEEEEDMEADAEVSAA